MASKYHRAARRAIKEYMRENHQQAVFSLYQLSLVADRAAREAGKKRDLYDSLDSYAALLPPGAWVFWNAGMAFFPLPTRTVPLLWGKFQKQSVFLVPSMPRWIWDRMPGRRRPEEGLCKKRGSARNVLDEVPIERVV